MKGFVVVFSLSPISSNPKALCSSHESMLWGVLSFLVIFGEMGVSSFS